MGMIAELAKRGLINKNGLTEKMIIGKPLTKGFGKPIGKIVGVKPKGDYFEIEMEITNKTVKKDMIMILLNGCFEGILYKKDVK